MNISIILWCPTRCMHYALCISIISHGRPTFPNAVLQRFVTLRSYRAIRAAAIANRLKMINRVASHAIYPLQVYGQHIFI